MPTVNPMPRKTTKKTAPNSAAKKPQSKTKFILAPRQREASPTGIAQIDPLDLAYAVGRLVAEGRTTAADVANLAAERTVRIQFLEAHLRPWTVVIGG